MNKYSEFTEQEIRGYANNCGERNIKVGQVYVMIDTHKPNGIQELQPDNLLIDDVVYEATKVQVTSIEHRSEYLYVGYKPFGKRYTNASFGYTRFYPDERDNKYASVFLKVVDFNVLRKEIQRQQDEINLWLHNEAFEDDAYVRDYINLYTEHSNRAFDGDKMVVQLGVNWSAIGTVSPEKALAYGQALVKASEVCKDFFYNGYEITYKS